MDTASKTRTRSLHTPFLPERAGGKKAFCTDIPLTADRAGNRPTVAALTMHALAVELRSFMNTHGLTQTDVATAAGLTQATVSRILHGEVTINVETLMSLEAGLQTSLWKPAQAAAIQRWREAYDGAAAAIIDTPALTPEQARAQVLSKIGADR